MAGAIPVKLVPQFDGKMPIFTEFFCQIVPGRHTFAALNFHCHAPTCLSMEVFACAKGTALPDCNATVGTLICREEPVRYLLANCCCALRLKRFALVLYEYRTSRTPPNLV